MQMARIADITEYAIYKLKVQDVKMWILLNALPTEIVLYNSKNYQSLIILQFWLYFYLLF
jgi:hypothetical protein